MLAAVTPLDVAFASAIATIVAAIAAPFVTWRTATGSWRHERQAARENRNHDARRDVYVAMLRWTRKKIEALEALRDAKDLPDPGPAEERDLLFARVTAFGSADVLSKISEFDHAWNDAWEDISAQLQAAREQHPEAGDPTATFDTSGLWTNLRTIGDAVRAELTEH